MCILNLINLQEVSLASEPTQKQHQQHQVQHMAQNHEVRHI